MPRAKPQARITIRHVILRRKVDVGPYTAGMSEETKVGRVYERSTPRVINVDKNPTYIGAVRDLKRDKLLPGKCKRRPSQYMNNIIEQDHCFIKGKIKLGLGFFSYLTAWRTIRGYEAMHIIRKG